MLPLALLCFDTSRFTLLTLLIASYLEKFQVRQIKWWRYTVVPIYLRCTQCLISTKRSLSICTLVCLSKYFFSNLAVTFWLYSSQPPLSFIQSHLADDPLDGATEVKIQEIDRQINNNGYCLGLWWALLNCFCWTKWWWLQCCCCYCNYYCCCCCCYLARFCLLHYYYYF